MKQTMGPKNLSVKIPQKCESDTELGRTQKPSSVIIIRQGSQIHQIPNPIDTHSITGSPRHIPKIKLVMPPFNKYEVIMELVCLCLYVYTWLPDRVSVNFELDGSFDNIQKEYFALILLGDTVFYFMMTVLQLLTHKFKYFVEVRKSTASTIFAYTRYFIFSFKLNTIVILLYITIALFNILEDQWDPQLIYITVLFLCLYFVSGFLYYKKLNQITNNPFI